MEVRLDKLTAMFEKWANGKASREEVMETGFSICREHPDLTNCMYDCVKKHAHSDLHSIVEDIAELLTNSRKEGQSIN